MRYILLPIWKAWFALCFVVPFLLLFPLFFWGLKTGRFDFVFRLKRLWARVISLGAGVIPRVRYQSKPYKLPKPCVVASNHTSYLDIIFSPFYIDHTAVFMGKYELLKAPLFSYFFKYLDIPVNRRSIKDSHKAFSLASEKIDQGLSQVIYPEGTISNFGDLRQFKNGAFRLAIEKQVPIVPVANLNNWKYLQNGGFFKSNGRPGFPTIIVGNPIPTAGLTQENLPEIREKVYTFIQQELDKFYGKRN